MKLILTFATIATMVTTSAYAEKLYILNTGSTGGSYNAQTQAWAKDLAEDYEVELIQAKGCQKAVALINKIDGNILTMFSGNWVGREGCQPLYPTAENHIYTDQKVGLIFGRKNNNTPFLTDGIKVAFNNDRDEFLQLIADVNGITIYPIEFENSNEITLAVLNGEVDFGYTDSAKDVWKNADKLVPLYNLSDTELEGIPSVTTIGGKAVAATVNFVYFGESKESLRMTMQDRSMEDNSAIRGYQEGQKGLISYLIADPITSYTAFSSTQ
jgi:hypothetical protein